MYIRLKMPNYDFCIVGAGPAGLTLTYILAKMGHRCALIEREETIGGCHRVTRDENDLFTEHSPRIYSGAYVNMKNILSDMGITFDDVFVKYSPGIWETIKDAVNNLSVRETLIISLEFVKLLANSSHGLDQSMYEFMVNHNFSIQSMEYLDRICRFTDGADMRGYSLNEFIKMSNQIALYAFYQPKLPNDVGLFKLWLEALNRTQKVDIYLNTHIYRLIVNNNQIVALEANSENHKLTGNEAIHADKFILAIPPMSLVGILSKTLPVNSSLEEIFGPITHWAKKTNYSSDIPIIFHWPEKLEIKPGNAFPYSEWGLVAIILSDSMNFMDIRSKTVISVGLTLPNIISSVTGKTANQSSLNELKTETFRQLNLIYPELNHQYLAIIGSGVRRQNGKWIDKDTGFVRTARSKVIEFQSPKYPNLYNLGTHNGYAEIAFTSFESAVTNAIQLAHLLDPQTKTRYKMSKLVTLTDASVLALLSVIMVISIVKIVGKR